MIELIAIGAGIVLLHELIRLLLDRSAWKSGQGPKPRAKNLLIRFFTILTFPLVLLIYLVAALWLLPYVLLSKPYKLHLKKQSEDNNSPDWHSGSPFAGQLSAISVPDFLSLPFKPIFAFMEWLGQRQTPKSAKIPAGQKSGSGTLHH